MEDNIKNENAHKDGMKTEIAKSLCSKWPDNITIINLSNSKIKKFDEEVTFPPKIEELIMRHNSLAEIPSAVLKLNSLLRLDLAFNEIVYFDETPAFCHSIVSLDLSNNHLEGPPYWVWSESPKHLKNLNISSNMKITRSIHEYYLEELVQYKTNLIEVKFSNCRLENHLALLKTFPRASTLEIGSLGLSINRNVLRSVPCTGLEDCCDVKKLNLMNTHLYSIEPRINIFKNITDIDLSMNSISHLPNEFCNLVTLESCILSSNNLLYLPNDIVKLENLVCLRLDSNELCMCPENLAELTKLKVLDLYDNKIYEIATNVRNVEELDLAMNYMDEPEEAWYCEKKEKLRINYSSRLNGRKMEDMKDTISDHSPSTTEDEELINYMNNLTTTDQETNERPPSSPEDWDNDDYWVPMYYRNITPAQSPWLSFIHQKMEKGNFCPMDIHPVSIDEQVKYDKIKNPRSWRVVSGQFDDYSEDDS